MCNSIFKVSILTLWQFTQLWYLSLENITNNTKKNKQYFVFNHIILIFNNSSKGNLIKNVRALIRHTKIIIFLFTKKTFRNKTLMLFIRVKKSLQKMIMVLHTMTSYQGYFFRCFTYRIEFPCRQTWKRCQYSFWPMPLPIPIGWNLQWKIYN